MDGSRKLKICYLADRHSLYDDRIYWKMALAMSQRGHSVHYLLMGDKEEQGYTEEGIGYQILKTKTFHTNRLLNFLIKRLNPNDNYRRMLKLAVEQKADVYHYHDFWLNRLVEPLKRKRPKARLIYDAREPYEADYAAYLSQATGWKAMSSWFAGRMRKWEEGMAAKADYVICNDEELADDFGQKLGEEKVVALLNYANFEPFYTTDALSPSKDIDLIYLGGITEERGPFETLKAFNILLESRPESRLVFLGPIDPAALKGRMEDFLLQHKMTERVMLIDQVSYAQVPGFLKRAKVGLILWRPLDNLAQKMPIKLFEYAAMGLPILGSDFGRIKRFLETYPLGVLADPFDARQLADAMQSLLEDDQRRQEIAQKAMQLSKSKFNWAAQIVKLEQMYLKQDPQGAKG